MFIYSVPNIYEVTSYPGQATLPKKSPVFNETSSTAILKPLYVGNRIQWLHNDDVRNYIIIFDYAH
jgi:hypothetical protein